LRLIFGPVAVEEHLKGSAPGMVLEAKEGRLLIAAGSGAVAPKSVQPIGKQMMSIDEFLRGYHVQVGDWFAAE
jgi:methionyl-tRNA formyltransferase